MAGEFEHLVITLRERLGESQSMVTAWSGGVDSTLVALAASQAVGDRALAVTVDTPFFARAEARRCKELAAELGLAHAVVELDLLKVAAVRRNDQQRCYHCKKAMTGAILNAHPGILLDGTNAGDDPERPGLRALQEANVVSPLKDLGFGKDRVRQMAAEQGLSNAELPSNSCLATRIRGGGLGFEELRGVEQLEEYLHEIGLADVRARYGDLKVIVEVPLSAGQILERYHERIKERVERLGWMLAGYGFRKEGCS